MISGLAHLPQNQNKKPTTYSNRRGLTDTEAYAGMAPDARKIMLHRAAETLPAKKFGEADDLAKGYLFVIDNPFVTGAIVDIDGGALIN